MILTLIRSPELRSSSFGFDFTFQISGWCTCQTIYPIWFRTV